MERHAWVTIKLLFETYGTYCPIFQMSQRQRSYDIERSWVNASNIAEFGDAIELRIVVWGDSHARFLLCVQSSVTHAVGSVRTISLKLIIFFASAVLTFDPF